MRYRMSLSFYSSQAYRLKQSARTQENWRIGKFDFLRRRMYRGCARRECKRSFSVAPHDPKKYCCQSCSAMVNNSARKWPKEVKQKISQALTGRVSPYRGICKVPRSETVCSNPMCRKVFQHERYRVRKYCSNRCLMSVVGGRPTSPKDSRGKAGVRKDISPATYFYSRWEANIARLYTYLNVTWIYTPTAFDIGGQMYTPDFYLPKKDCYVEVKNFWWSYSKERDEKFRKCYPNIRLDVILKEKYLKLEKKYSRHIPNWEYKNSKI